MTARMNRNEQPVEFEKIVKICMGCIKYTIHATAVDGINCIIDKQLVSNEDAALFEVAE
jgi:hypothetical protein